LRCWWSVTQCTMGPDMVIVLDPFTNNDLCLLQTIEDLPIQKVISKGAVKAFTKAIFPGAARGR